MTIASTGYDGTVDETRWAKLAPALGADYRFLGGCAATVAAGQDRAVQISPGTLYGWGVLDEIDAPETVTTTAVGSGVRWDTIVLRRNWQPAGGLSQFVVVPGTSLQELAGGLQQTPGVLDDQPTHLIKVAAGQTAIQQIVPLSFGRHTPLYSTSADLPAADRFTDGQPLTQNLNGRYRQYIKTGSGLTAKWVDVDRPAWSPLALPGSAATGVRKTAFSPPPASQFRAGRVYLRGAVERNNGAQFDGTPVVVAVLPVGSRPDAVMVFTTAAQYTTSNVSARVEIGPDGVIKAIAPISAGHEWVGLDGIDFEVGA